MIRKFGVAEVVDPPVMVVEVEAATILLKRLVRKVSMPQQTVEYDDVTRFHDDGDRILHIGWFGTLPLMTSGYDTGCASFQSKRIDSEQRITNHWTMRPRDGYADVAVH